MNPTRAKAKARQILSELGIDSPDLLKHLKEICVERGAFVKLEAMHGAEGRLVISGNRGIITVRPNDTYLGRTRFSIAHELGHFELHRAVQSFWDCTASDMNDWRQKKESENREHEANEFAAELLMPELFLRARIDGKRPSLNALKELAVEFGVSLTAACLRYSELTQQACAFVFSRQGQIAYTWKSRLFEAQKLWIEPNIDYAKEKLARAGRGASTGLTPVEAGNWLKLPNHLQEERIHEQSEYFRNLDLGLTLLWVDEGPLIREVVRDVV